MSAKIRAIETPLAQLQLPNISPEELKAAAPFDRQVAAWMLRTDPSFTASTMTFCAALAMKLQAGK
jgi:hypothetical protein